MTHLLLAVIYIAFISLGLPDALLGAAWPSMYGQLDVPVSAAGAVSMIICAGTVASSLLSDRLTRALGTGLLTAFSVATTAAALFGFSVSQSFAALCLWAVPYGLGAGSVDAALNNYVALHYQSRHMSWLHCMWGLGAILGPYVMSWALTSGSGWSGGYRTISWIQVGLTAVLFASLPLWRSKRPQQAAAGARPVPFGKILRVPGAAAAMLTFFCYCALEGTAILWASTYLALVEGAAAETAARYGSLFFIGITLGRALSGFVTMKLTDRQMVRLGQGIIAVGITALLLPFGLASAAAAFVIIGLGCGPIYPCMLHATPDNFGEDRSQAVMGLQMACAYVGTTLMPPLFGQLAGSTHVSWLPWFLGGILAVMVLAHARLTRQIPLSQSPAGRRETH